MALTVFLAFTTATFLALMLNFLFKNSDLTELLDQWVEYSEYQGTELEAAQTKAKSLQATNDLQTEQLTANTKLIAELRREIERQDADIRRIARENGGYLARIHQLEDTTRQLSREVLEEAFPLKGDDLNHCLIQVPEAMQEALNPPHAGHNSADVGTDCCSDVPPAKAPEGTTKIKVIPQYSYNPPPTPPAWPAVYADVTEHKPQPLPNDYA
jgi:hypothetical protein